MDNSKRTTPDRQCKYLHSISTLTELFSPDECERIIDNGLNNWEEQKSTIQANTEQPSDIENNDIRNVTMFISPKPEEELNNKIIGAIMHVNSTENSYGFDVYGMAEPCALMRYQSPDLSPNGKPGKYDWHMDIGVNSILTMRKLSYSLLLNAGDYEGGKLEFFGDKDTGSQDDCGSMIIFPSYLVHRVLPVTKGTRYALVGWLHGNSCK